MKKRKFLVLLVLGTAALVYAGIAASTPKTAAKPADECCDPNSPEMCGLPATAPAATKTDAKPVASKL